jgi:hypothetical protein
MAASLNIPYQHPAVRDLAWAMISPGLLQAAPAGQALVTDEWCRHVYATHEHRLRQLDEDPTALTTALAENKSHRLGVYFESLLLFWLKNILQVEHLQHNVPIFEQLKSAGKRTLGEFDFLFRQAGEESLQHWEATVKFYLLKSDEAGNAYWVGPGGRDRLDRKLDRIFQHQLRLAELPQTQDFLQLEGSDSILPAALIKGYLFYPLQENGEMAQHAISGEGAGSTPYALSRHHQKGWWLNWQTVPFPKTASDTRWLILSKFRWLSPAYQTGEAVSLMDTNALAEFLNQYFQQQGGPLLLAEMQCQTGIFGAVWQEVARGFVLPPA